MSSDEEKALESVASRSSDRLSTPSLENTHRNRQKRHIISRSAFNPYVDEEQVFEFAKDHQSYSYGRLKFENLPRFEDCKWMGLTEDEENETLRNEIKSLTQFVTAGTPPLFDSSESLGQTDLAGFNDLAALVDQVRCNLAIIEHDNACVALRNHPHERFLDSFRTSRRLLRERYQETPNAVKVYPPKTLEPKDRNVCAYHSLVDYVLGCLGWWLLRIAHNKNWDAQVVALLARWAMKLKIVSLDPGWWAGRALGEGAELMEELSEASKEDNKIMVTLPNGISRDPAPFDFSREEKTVAASYYRDKIYFRERIIGLLRDVILTNLGTAYGDSNAYELCTLLYKSGLERTLTLLTSERGNSILGSSDPSVTNRSYSAIRLLLINADRVSAATQPGRRLEQPTQVTWWRVESTPTASVHKRTILTDNLDYMISMLVPLTLSSQGAARFDPAISSLLWWDEEDPLQVFEPPPPEFEIKFTMTTHEQLERRHQLEHSPFYDPSVRPLSRAHLTKDLRAETNLAKLLEHKDDAMDTRSNNMVNQLVLQDYKKHQSRMKEWEISERNVRVPCWGYSRIFQVFALLLVSGSLAIPLTVGQRIAGVDPFQFVTFAWLLVGAILVTAKSRFVTEWPWHDFLRGFVVCGSVIELQKVTGIDSQLILMFLLHNEERNMLQFSGPYTGLFSKKVESGFVIDVPTELSTALATGFVIAKAQDLKGEFLEFQDLRDHPCRSREADPLMCREIEKLEDAEMRVAAGQSRQRPQVLQLKRDGYQGRSWNLGLYNNNEVRFG